MNIFFVNADPVEAAQSLVDRHVVKMILESCQLLSTSHRLLDGDEYIDTSKSRKIKRWRLNDDREGVIYSATHVNHPCAVWVRESVENYNWLTEHLYGLLQEYTYRYNKTHSCFPLFYTLQSPPHNLKTWDFTKPPSAMAKEYIVSDDPVENYRNYYRNGKIHLHKWKNRTPPEWL